MKPVFIQSSTEPPPERRVTASAAWESEGGRPPAGLPRNSAGGRVVSGMVYPYSAGVIGGVWGGLVMIVVAAGYGLVTGHGIWYPVNLIAAAALPNLAAMPLAALNQFHPDGLIAGLLIHLIMSVGIGLLFAVILPTLPGHPALWALSVGPILWFAATFFLLPLFDPMLQRAVDWPSFFVAHVCYRFVMGMWVARTPKIPDYSA